jgi:hypothetical protein
MSWTGTSVVLSTARAMSFAALPLYTVVGPSEGLRPPQDDIGDP